MKRELVDVEAVRKELRRIESKEAELDRLVKTEPEFRAEAEALKDKILAAMGPDGLFLPAADCKNPELADALRTMSSLRTRFELLPMAKANLAGEITGLKQTLGRDVGAVRELFSAAAQRESAKVRTAIRNVVRPFTTEPATRLDKWVEGFISLSQAGRWVLTFSAPNYSRDPLVAARELIARAAKFEAWLAKEEARATGGA